MFTYIELTLLRLEPWFINEYEYVTSDFPSFKMAIRQPRRLCAKGMSSLGFSRIIKSFGEERGTYRIFRGGGSAEA